LADRFRETIRQNHRVLASTVRDWMDHWKYDQTVDGIFDDRSGK